MADAQIANSAVAAGESVYTLSPAVEFTLKTVSAEFADNGAAAAWLPAVLIASDAGLTIVRAVDQAVQVAAGSDAAVSFFPGVKHAAGASGGLLDLDFCYAQGNIDMNAGAPTYFTFAPSDPAVYDLAGALLNVVRILQPGTYLAFPYSEWTTTTGAPAVTTRVRLSLGVAFAGAGGSHEPVHDGLLGLGSNDASGVAGHFVWQTHGIELVNVQASSPPVSLTLAATNTSASTLGSSDTALTVVRIRETPYAGLF